MDFVTGLPISTNWKGKSYNFILVIVNWLTKIVYNELVKVTIYAMRLDEVLLDVVVQYQSLLNSIVIDRGLLYTFKF